MSSNNNCVINITYSKFEQPSQEIYEDEYEDDFYEDEFTYACNYHDQRDKKSKKSTVAMENNKVQQFAKKPSESVIERNKVRKTDKEKAIECHKNPTKKEVVENVDCASKLTIN